MGLKAAEVDRPREGVPECRSGDGAPTPREAPLAKRAPSDSPQRSRLRPVVRCRGRALRHGGHERDDPSGGDRVAVPEGGLQVPEALRQGSGQGDDHLGRRLAQAGAQGHAGRRLQPGLPRHARAHGDGRRPGARDGPRRAAAADAGRRGDGPLRPRGPRRAAARAAVHARRRRHARGPRLFFLCKKK